MASRKSSVQTAVVRQAHGGTLRVGGKPGNAGGSGRLRSEVREAALAGAKQAIPKLIRLMKKGDDSVAVKASDVLLKYGLGPSNAMPADQVRANMEETISILREVFAAYPELLDEAFQRMKPVWTT